MLTTDQVQLVQQTWSQIDKPPEDLGRLFYTRLFELEPDLRPLFSTDLAAQARSLMKMLSLVVSGLDRLDTLIPAVKALGLRHQGYGVAAAHYDLVGAALVWMLQQELGDAFTHSVRRAWSDAYQILAGVMLDAVAEQAD